MKARVIAKREETDGIKTFIFEPEEKYEYEAGQFAFFNFEKNGKQTKHFTISNSPTRKNIEMTTIVSNSDYKQALDSLEKGNEIDIQEPMGNFTLNKKEKPIVFLVGGIGITPVRSMLEYLADKKMDKTIILLYANKNKKRIVFKEELEELNKKIPSFEIAHFTSEEENPDTEKERIDAERINKYSLNLKPIYMVVGPPAFVKAMDNILRDMNIEKDRILKENFSGY